MNKRIDIIYNTNKQEWELERIAEKHGFALIDNCYWVQIMRNQDGDSIVLTREDSAMAHDPVERLIAILETTETETTETETTETETTETETTNDRKQYIATFMDGLDGAIRVEFLEATDEKHARYKAQHMAGMFETVENVREVDPDDFEEISGVPVPCFTDVMSNDEIGGTIDALKKAVAPLEKEMEENNVSRDRLAQLDKEVVSTWEEIGVLQYLQIVQGTGVDPSGRKFRDVEMGEIVTIDDVLHTWAAYKEIREEHPHFPKYLGNCQTFKGGTLEEIRE